MELTLFSQSKMSAALGCVAIFILLFWSNSSSAQNGTLSNPFTHTSHAHNATSSGRYYFDLGNGLFQANVDTSQGGGWILVAQYRYKDGTNPPLTVLVPGDNFPVHQGVNMGIDGSLTPSEWGHAGNAAMSQFGGDVELYFYGRTSDHTRLVKFTTPLGSDYIKTGIGSFVNIQDSSNHTLLSGHTGVIPAGVTHNFANQGDLALTNFPFYKNGHNLWGIKGSNTRWEMDNITTDNTHHQIYARTAPVDSSDAPASYGETHHVHDAGLFLGNNNDVDTASLTSANADGDGVEDDGVTMPGLYHGNAGQIKVRVEQAAASDGYLQGWIDWNGDGDFADSGEQVATDLQYSAGTAGNIYVPVTPPMTATTSQTFARFRWSTTSGLDSTTVAPDGEVEDYAVTVGAVDAGIDSFTCPYVQNMDTAAPIYNAISYYALGNVVGNNGWHVSNSGQSGGQANNITSDASGTGKFMMHLTNSVGLSSGEIFGSPNSIPVSPNTDYIFSFKLNNWGTGNLAQIQPSINGTPIGSAVSATGSNTWESFEVTWNSGSATTATLSLANNTNLASGNNFGLDEVSLCLPPSDYSDAPTSYGETRHVHDAGLFLGNNNDVDTASLTSANADGDGVEDDGVTMPGLYHGNAGQIKVRVEQAAASDGYLQGWIDWNGDGDFADSGEQVATDLQYSAGTAGNIYVPVTPPMTATTSQTFARFRWSTTSGLDSTTVAPDGEVEDYAVTVGAVDAGIDSFTCPYVQNMDTAAPIYNAISYYALGNVVGNNGWHVSNSGQSGGQANNITSDASGTGKFMLHLTNSVGLSSGEIFGSPNTIPVSPNTDYIFSFKLNNWGTGNLAQIQPSINGTPIGAAVSATGSGTWQTFTVGWNSGSATTATLSLANNMNLASGNNFGLDEVSFCRPPSDYSDAPTSYGEPGHEVVSGMHLGASIDIDTSSAASANADGDTDDGVTIPALYHDTDTTITAAINQIPANDGYLQGWIDWNGDGDFDDSGEQIASDLQYTSGTSGNIDVPITPPVTAVTSQTFARFRWSTTSGRDSRTPEFDGEVEDYAVTVRAVDAGDDSLYCPYIQNMDIAAPLYSSIPYYALGNETSSNGWYVANSSESGGSSKIATDASGSGKFMMHATAPSGSATGEVFGSHTPITVTTNTNYEFSFKLNNEHTANVAQIQPSINGTPIGVPVSATGSGTWQTFTVTWNSGSATTATLSLANNTTAASGNNFGLDEVSFCQPQVDYSDAPISGTSYGEAEHSIVPNFKLGAVVDVDPSSIASPLADGDGADDDGVTFPTLTQSASATITVAVNQAAASDGYLQGWIDWNGDGDFADVGEQVATNLQYSAGTSGNISVSVSVPATATLSPTFARFRWSKTSGLNSTASADAGEVEDYLIKIAENYTSVPPPSSGPGSLSEPFIHTSLAHDVASSGRYYFDLGNGPFQAEVDTSNGGGWILVGQYRHKGGTNPALNVVTAGSDFPVRQGASLGTDGSLNSTEWGHAGNAAMDQFGGDIETRFYGRAGDHSRVLHFSTPLGSNYLKTGTGSFTGIDNSSNHTLLPGHTAVVPVAVTNAWPDQGDLALTEYPFLKTGGAGVGAYWSISALGTRWAMDSYVSSSSVDTHHQIYARTAPATYDRSDAPILGTSYGDVYHIIDANLHLGNTIDSETASIASANADGDGTDDDGVVIPLLHENTSATITVSVNQVAAYDGYLQGWIDWNGDGDFADTGEQIATDLRYNAGSSGDISVPVTPPSNITVSQTFARFRWSTISGLDSTTPAYDGEVEDYAVAINLAEDFTSVPPPASGPGSLSAPFTHTSEAHSVSSSGRYYFNLGSGSFQADVDTSNGGGWILVGQYRHKGGTSPALNVVTAGSDFPKRQGFNFGINGSLTLSEWGHAGNAAMSQFGGNIETRFYGRTTDHNRVIHFSTTVGSDYAKTGTGSFTGIDNSSNHTLLSDHTAIVPAGVTHAWSDKGDLAFTEFPFFKTGGAGVGAYWSVKALNSRWEMDNLAANSLHGTHHQIYARTAPATYDRSDAPASYGEADHIIDSDIRLGALVDVEAPSIASANADGDGADDDGVTLPSMTQGITVSVTVAVNQAAASDGYLQGWIDWNGDGDFADAGEQVATDLQYSAGTSGNISVSVSVPAPATLSPTFARFRWSKTSGLDSTTLAGSGEVEDYAITVAGGGELDAVKSVAMWDPLSEGLYALPDNDVVHTITVSNIGSGATDANTIALIDQIPAEMEFYNGDIDDGGPETDPVSFAQTGGAGLTFSYATDIAYSDSATKPANFAACGYTPSSGYDANVTYICINPKGSMAAGDPDPTFSVSFRARIE